jgi:hypothetical protein
VNRPRRLLLAAGALTVLLAVVALASRAHRPGAGTTGARAHVPVLLGEYVGVMMLLLILVAAVVTGWGVADDRRKRMLAGRTSWRRTLTGILTVVVAVVVGLAYTRNLRQNTTPRAQAPPGIGAPLRAVARQRAKLQRPTPPARNTDVLWLTVLVLGSVVLGVAVAAGVALRHRRAHGDELDEEAALARALDEVLADTLDDLREERDPRRAVIRVYARMERTFAAYRVPRDPAETPLEYVARVLASLSVSARGVRRVTLLFERAKFSSHEVDARMKVEAIEALAGVRAELELQGREEAA